MGDAKRRRAEIEKLKSASDAWRSTLTPAELKAASIAERAHSNLVERQKLIGACYLLAFFLRRYMRENGIKAEAIVGWVNDGTTSLMISHAWIEVGGKKIDIALTLTEDPDVQLPGPLLILDQVIRRGKVAYTYHRAQTAEALSALAELRKAAPPRVADFLDRKTAEHLKMEATAKSESLMNAYLDAAPTDRNYAALARALT